MVPAFIRVANKLWSSLGAKVSLVAQLVKNLLVKRPWFDSWVRKIPWRRGMATDSNILAWRIPMDREAWHAMVHGVANSWT